MTGTQHLHVGSRRFKTVVYAETGYAVVRLEWHSTGEQYESFDIALFPNDDVLTTYADEFMRASEALRAIAKRASADAPVEDAA